MKLYTEPHIHQTDDGSYAMDVIRITPYYIDATIRNLKGFEIAKLKLLRTLVADEEAGAE